MKNNGRLAFHISLSLFNRFSLLFVLLVLLLNPLRAIAHDIYTDALTNNWVVGNWGCSSVNLKAKPTGRIGAFATAVTENCAWGGFGFERRSADWQNIYWIAPNEYSTVEFEIKPITSGAVPHLYLTTATNNSVKVSDYISSRRADGWLHIRVPLALLTNERFFRIYLQSDVNQQVRYYLDDLKLVAPSQPANRPPVVNATASALSGVSPLTVNFNASGSSDPDGNVLTYAWAFGDGTFATGITASHIFNNTTQAAVTFNVALTVTDTLGASATKQFAITVNPVPPAPTPVPTPTPSDKVFYEPFKWQGNHAATVANGASNTVWWNPDNWDVRLDTAYLATTGIPGYGTNTSHGWHIDIHKAAAPNDPTNGEEDNSVYAIGGDGSAGVGTMRMEYQGIGSARLRNPMLISSTQPGVVEFYATKFITTAFWWEIAITPANRVVGGELTAVTGNDDGVIDAFSYGYCDRRTNINTCEAANGPGHRRGVDSINVIAHSPTDVPHITGWWFQLQIIKLINSESTTGFGEHFVSKISDFSQLIPTDPSEADKLVRWRIEFRPSRIDAYADFEHNNQFKLVNSFPVSIPWSEVHVHLIGATYQADHHPQPPSYLGIVRELHWRNVKVSPIKYKRTTVAPQDGITEINSRKLGWMAYDLRDIQRFGAQPINGILQPNIDAYREHGQSLFTSIYEYNDAPAPVDGAYDPPGMGHAAPIYVDVTVEQAGAAMARLIYDIRNYDWGKFPPGTKGTAAVYINGRFVGTLAPAPGPRPTLAASQWEHTSIELPAGALIAGRNKVELRFSGPIQLDRLQLEFSHAN